MATQQFGYGPNVWAPAKGIGVQQFAKLQQPGAVAPQFKAENKYKALAAKAIGEMAYGAMMNQEAKKQQAAKEAELKAFNKKNAQMNAQRRQTFDVGFDPTIVLETENTEDKTTKSTESNTTVNFDATNYNKGVSPTHVPIGKEAGGSWSWSRNEAPTSIGAALGFKDADFTKGIWVYNQPSGKRNKTTGYK